LCAIGQYKALLTIDGNGNALSQGVAISANEGGNLAQLVDLQVVGRGIFASLNFLNLEVEPVGLGDQFDGLGAGVVLGHGQLGRYK